ncbi:MAG: hypothetical protein JWN44_3232 [Myxococcales bacterium]|nr:hypothetical protein [Myxococcales bacterium]
MKERASKFAVAAAALVALLALVETAVALTAGARVAPASDWDAAAAEVRAGFGPGDLIAFAPAWADQVGRAHLGDLVTVEMAGRSDADRYARVWEVSIRGSHAPEVAGARLVKESRHGRVRVALYEKPAAHVVWDFTAHADEARVTQTPGTSPPTGGNETPCYADPGPSWRCPGSRLERRTLEIDYRPRRGILAPAESARATHLAFTEVPLGARLVVYAGIHDYYARKNGSGLVDLALVVDGKELLAARVANSDGWKRYEIDTRALAGGRHTVRFDLGATDPAWRNLGFHAEARQ